jgi:uncharacterized protein with PIN domain
MALSRSRLERLLRWIAATRERELNCEECLERMAEFAESELVGRTLPEGLEAVEQHLTVCDECREEYEVLQRALEDYAE